ncbi:TraB/GumN family protein [Novosphingobium capsulatum]|uniref:TraB/GumN family protein n=2 Tax=Novosphingobium capsulatum TaxID=13688 RepID=UPI000788A618|nr:TraB/GumN family protein [Novosphingobium capsulatum]
MTMTMRWKPFLVAALALLAAACHKAAPPPLPAKVALWEIADTSGTRGWIFGTVHALPAGVQWRRPAIDHALANADRLVLEIAQPLDGNVAGVALARLAYTPGLPPPSARVAMKYRDALAKVYKDLNLTDAQFQNEESWAVALQIAAIGGQKEGMDPASGVEPQLRKLIGGKPVAGLETLDGQFGIFDALPDRAQQTLLEQVAVEAADNRDDDADMVRLWLRGDDLGIARESQKGFLSDPTLHQALLTARNAAWASQIDAMLKDGAAPFIAVGAAHVAGSDGLPALLQAKGWLVRRVE